MSEDHGPRLSRVEGDVETIRADMGGLKTQVTGLEAQMRGFGDILQRIEQGVQMAQQRQDRERQASRLNPMALATILLSIISILVGGSWLISGEIARHDERSVHQQKLLDRLEHRAWSHHALPGRRE